MKLYSYWRSSAAYRVRLALNLKRLDYQLEPLHLLNGGGQQFSEGYTRLNPQQRVPTLVLDDGRLLTQSLAIIDYLELTEPDPALLPWSAYDRAWVESLAQLVACDIHPLNNLRVIRYLQDELGLEQAARDGWYRHWLAQGLSAFEAMLAQRYPDTDVLPHYCWGGEPSLADICLIPQLYNARRYQLALDAYPRLLHIEQHCNSLTAFIDAHPANQPDADQ